MEFRGATVSFSVYSPGNHLNLDAGFNYFVCSPVFGQDEPNLTCAYFSDGWGSSTTNQAQHISTGCNPQPWIPTNHGERTTSKESAGHASSRYTGTSVGSPGTVGKLRKVEGGELGAWSYSYSL